jgi:outer membrane protein OmpA-like peptidoglycan-associated protein
MTHLALRRALATALTAAAVLGGASTASAAGGATTVGPTDLTTAVMPFGTDDETFINNDVPPGSLATSPSSGRIVNWRANVLTTGPIRLAVVTPKSSPGEYTVTAIDEQVAGSVGVNTFTPSTPLAIANGQTIALIQIPGGAVPRYGDDPSATFWVKSGAIAPMTPTAGQTFTAPVNVGGAVLFNADVATVVDPPQLQGTGAFGEVVVGETSATSTFDVTNAGVNALAIGHHDVQLAGPSAGDFVIASDTCSGDTLAHGESCAVGVRFKPTAAGARTATLSIASNADLSPTTVALSGTGRAPVKPPVDEPTKQEPPVDGPTKQAPADDTPTQTKPPVTEGPAPEKPSAPAAAPELQAVVGGGTSGSQQLGVGRRALSVACAVTGTTLTACRVDLYANAPDRGARASARVLVGTGTVERRAGTDKMTVKVVLNATGKRLLRRAPRGLPVSAEVTGTALDGGTLRASGSSRLVSLRSSAVIGGFAESSANLSRAARKQVREIARAARGAKVVQCIGHTEGPGRGARYLRALGLQRAKAVCSLLNAHGVEARLVVRSRGADTPRASNRTAAGRAANRRVVVRIAR